MKSALRVQVDVCSDLRMITADVSQRVSSLEGHVEVPRNATRDNACGAPVLEASGGSAVDAAEGSERAAECAGRGDGNGALALCVNTGANLNEKPLQDPGSPKWSTIAKKGKRQLEARTIYKVHLQNGVHL
uniref:Uncharacterized protein n=1 Tax=Knipowitschia caucasica TaxID=637954 RepID=A0AAV2JTM1_KNICA